MWQNVQKVVSKGKEIAGNARIQQKAKSAIEGAGKNLISGALDITRRKGGPIQGLGELAKNAIAVDGKNSLTGFGVRKPGLNIVKNTIDGVAGRDGRVFNQKEVNKAIEKTGNAKTMSRYGESFVKGLKKFVGK